MTTLLKLKGVTLPGSGYPNVNDFVVPAFPNSGGLVGMYTFGSQLGMSLTNHVNSSLPLIPHGTVQTSVDGAVVSRPNYLDTQLPNTDSYSVISLCLPILATNFAGGQIILGNYKSGDANQGESIGMSGKNGAGVPAVGSFVTDGANDIVQRYMDLPAGMVTTRHAGIGARISADGKAKMFVLDNGVLTAGAETAAQARISHSARSMLIGGGYNTGGTNWTGQLTIKLLAVWNVALTDQQMYDNMAYLATIYPELMAA